MGKGSRMAKYKKENLTFEEIYQKEEIAKQKQMEAHQAYEQVKSDHKMYKETGQFPDHFEEEEMETQTEEEEEEEIEMNEELEMEAEVFESILATIYIYRAPIKEESRESQKEVGGSEICHEVRVLGKAAKISGRATNSR